MRLGVTTITKTACNKFEDKIPSVYNPSPTCGDIEKNKKPNEDL